ncbi:MAG TPA: hypothetical protein VN858_11195 [Casimicrobiaceae bacterium]|nr:hypothetical protein [Casimicrobiaceae bacterium]
MLVTMLPDDRIVHDVLAGYGADDTPGSMLRACETRGGVRREP